MHEVFRVSEPNPGGAAADAEDNSIDQIRSRMRKRHALACVRRSAALAFHDRVGQPVVILDQSVIAQLLHDLEDRFRGRLLAQLQHHQFRIEDIVKERRHLETCSD